MQLAVVPQSCAVLCTVTYCCSDTIVLVTPIVHVTLLFVTSGRLVRLDLSPFALTVTVSGSDAVQLVLKPLSESLGRLVLLIRIGVRGDSVGLQPRQRR